MYLKKSSTRIINTHWIPWKNLVICEFASSAHPQMEKLWLHAVQRTSIFTHLYSMNWTNDLTEEYQNKPLAAAFQSPNIRYK